MRREMRSYFKPLVKHRLLRVDNIVVPSFFAFLVWRGGRGKGGKRTNKEYSYLFVEGRFFRRSRSRVSRGSGPRSTSIRRSVARWVRGDRRYRAVPWRNGGRRRGGGALSGFGSFKGFHKYGGVRVGSGHGVGVAADGVGFVGVVVMVVIVVVDDVDVVMVGVVRAVGWGSGERPGQNEDRCRGVRAPQTLQTPKAVSTVIGKRVGQIGGGVDGREGARGEGRRVCIGRLWVFLVS